MPAVDYFLKIDGIQGESTDAKHKNEIELTSFSWGATNTSQVSTGHGAGRVTFQDFEFSKLFDKASPQIFLKCVTGSHITSVTLSARKSSNSEVANPDFLKIVFSNVLISFYKEQEPNRDQFTSESVGALFAKMSLTFTPSNPVTGAAAAQPVTVNADVQGSDAG
jgi:type VI secretion system secreted protein Hcp